MGIEKVAGFFLAAAGGFIVLSATFVLALIAYRRRRERGFLLLLCALGSGLLVKVLAIIFLGPGTFFPMDYTTQNLLSRLVWGLDSLTPVLTLVGWAMLARMKKKA